MRGVYSSLFWWVYFFSVGGRDSISHLYPPTSGTSAAAAKRFPHLYISFPPRRRRKKHNKEETNVAVFHNTTTPDDKRFKTFHLLLLYIFSDFIFLFIFFNMLV
jgi:hypothetical protein